MLLHFNDVHARLDRFPLLCTLIGQARAEATSARRPVLVFDAGDSSDRASWESDITKGRINFSLLASMGVQASVIGNAEAQQWGRGALADLVTSVPFPLLAGNLVDFADQSRLAVNGLLGHCILRAGDLRVGVIGVTAPMALGGYERFGYTATDPVRVIRRELEALRAEGASLLVLLSHLGAEPLPPTIGPGPIDEQIAAACPDLHVVVGGHTHTQLTQPLVVGKTLIVQAGAMGEFLGRLDLDIDPESATIRTYKYTLLATEGVPPEVTLEARLEQLRTEAAALLDTVIGEVTGDIPHFLERPSLFGRLVADALREIAGADLAILFSGFLREGIRRGPIRRRDLYQAAPGTTHVTGAEVSGAQIRRMLERMLASRYRTEPFDSRRGMPPLGLPSWSSNVDVRYDVDREPGQRVVRCLVNGMPLEMSRRYRLASTFYTLNPVAGHPDYDFIGVEPGQQVINIRVEQVLWEVLEEWLRVKSPLKAPEL